MKSTGFVTCVLAPGGVARKSIFGGNFNAFAVVALNNTLYTENFLIKLSWGLDLSVQIPS